ncbi:Hypothetical predicted protein [Octopus vulgaris]|uniref:Uncharacterized protein n=1 Tax=Octopus vulgaris TaxID=6645 RepID=A0AA36EVB4_OCTVU|nr:Hypothetical predicted protein [Octopus vulgaris]
MQEKVQTGGQRLDKNSTQKEKDNKKGEMEKSKEEQIDAGNIPTDVTVGLNADKKPHEEQSRSYILPTSKELAIFIPNNLDEEMNCSERVVVTKFRADNNQKSSQILSDSHRSYDPMMYPYFLSSGLDGWDLGLMNENGNRQISIDQFYCYRIMKRTGSTNLLQLGQNDYSTVFLGLPAAIDDLRMHTVLLHKFRWIQMRKKYSKLTSIC